MRNTVDALDVSPDQEDGQADEREGEIPYHPEERAEDDDRPLPPRRRMVEVTLVDNAVAIVIPTVFQLLIAAVGIDAAIGFVI